MGRSDPKTERSQAMSTPSMYFKAAAERDELLQKVQQLEELLEESNWVMGCHVGRDSLMDVTLNDQIKRNTAAISQSKEGA